MMVVAIAGSASTETLPNRATPNAHLSAFFVQFLILERSPTAIFVESLRDTTLARRRFEMGSGSSTALRCRVGGPEGVAVTPREACEHARRLAVA